MGQEILGSLADTYEDLFVVGRKLNLSAEEQSQQYRRMVFNVLAENVDDHTKNFSFVMYPNGEWHISPAYDIVFSADPDSPFYRYHELTYPALVDFHLLCIRLEVHYHSFHFFNDMRSISDILSYAEKVEIDERWIRKIERVLKE